MAKTRSIEFFVLWFSVWHGFGACLKCSSPTPEVLFKELEENVFSKALWRPVSNFSNVLNVTISITVVGVVGVDEKSQQFTTLLWQVLEWDIPDLSWDEEECGTRRVSVPREKIWLPDIQVSEFIEEDKAPKPPYVYLDNQGHVFDDKPLKMISSCQLGIYTFPFDIQHCKLTFGSYLHLASDIWMTHGSTAEDMLQESKSVMKSNGEWELVDISVEHSTLGMDVGSYSQIEFVIGIKRRPTMYVVNLLLPSSFLITVDLFSFLLPPHSVDRSSFKMTLILGYTVFLLIMNDLLPITGETTPLINVFFSISLALMVASLLETVFITSIQFSSNQYSAVPHWLSVLILHYLAIVVCIPPKKKSNRTTVFFNRSAKEAGVDAGTLNLSGSLSDLADKPPPEAAPPGPPTPPDSTLKELQKLNRDLAAIRAQVDKYFQNSDTAQEWQMIGTVVDRLLFGLYIVFIVISFVTIIGIWAWNNTYGL